MIASNVSSLNPDGLENTQSNVWVPLIWKALNYYGYDVKSECLKVELKDSDYEIFNKFVIELANLPGWAEYAANILLNDNNNYKSNDNDFESDIVKTKTIEYTNMVNDNIEKYKKDHEKYKMNTYRHKYLKYKQKYMMLKNNL